MEEVLGWVSKGKIKPVIDTILPFSEKYREDLREGEYRRLDKDLFIQKPLSIKKLIKEIHRRIDSTG